ncbi:ERF family protein [Pasteurella multocida]|uniref:ERF family protein n=1 Tax=Pasteurella multocida TaxID=747 RepID=UPI0002839188|nr:ERF family protein [Pasteurella multocida]ARB76456.1 single-stranded DNA-binding protein [Pasteurella multocida]EJZ80313.1 putative phage essential recombination function protein [Pasteurella multocida subsp. gallicida P1059]NMR51789.1 single-stranded DNA-binding protein [Pasteurella multocida]NMR61729.1 single-stranded DNA-binding protein [Pasteurella multocida]OBP30583.1 single-stranded DNA-binding protein [Pasteurella multocida subsp. multocida]
MNIYQKLAQARVKLQEKGLKKTGKNRSFNYFELKDFLPSVNEIFAQLNMCSVISYTSELATLTIYDGEKDEKIIFTSPMVEKALPSGTDIQNLGAIQTYQRRYLYLTALEIAENDMVDSLDTGGEQPAPPKSASQSNSKPPIQQNTSSGQTKKPFDEMVKERLNQCNSKEELTSLYDPLVKWVGEKHPDKVDEFNIIYNDKVLSFM